MSSQVFVSYSHDDEDHKSWVLKLATRLRSNSVEVILDQWNLSLGKDLAAFMEHGLPGSRRVLCICSEKYVKKANDKIGGVGYEKQIMTSELLRGLNSDWIIPIVRKNDGGLKLPTFLGGRFYLNFDDDALYEKNYEDLLRNLLDEPLLPIPPLGENPFKITNFEFDGKFIAANEKYISPSFSGRVNFDYSNNNGVYSIGNSALLFELKFSKSSDVSIQIISSTASIHSLAVIKDKSEIGQIADARDYDFSSANRRPKVNQLAVFRNVNGFYAAIKILGIKDDTRGPSLDEITFDYVIQTNRTADFSTIT